MQKFRGMRDITKRPLPVQDATVCLLLRDDPAQICLAMKKRGFGTGKWNGPGGKVESHRGETPEEALHRETLEEIGVRVREPEKVAEIAFYFTHTSEWNQLVHVYQTYLWENEPAESEEMRPQWFDLSEIPYDDMWADDEVWMPKVLSGKLIRAWFLFDDKEKILQQVLEDVANF